jgi:hypothetical protein
LILTAKDKDETAASCKQAEAGAQKANDQLLKRNQDNRLIQATAIEFSDIFSP